MQRTTFSLLGIALVAILALFAFASPACAQTGSGPDDGLDFGVWRSLDFNQEQWMCFNYEGDNSNIQLDVFLEPGNSAEVRVRTPENIETWRTTGGDPCTGCGTADPVAKGDLHWDGSFNMEGQYCVTVKHNRSRAEAAYYKAEIVGEGVSFPGPMDAAEEAGTREMVEPEPVAAPPAEESRSMMGSGPDYAMVPGNWMEIGFNEVHWYVFSVTDPAADISIELFVDGDANAADFLVRMPADVKVWRDTGQNPCIGCGTTDAFVKGDKSWRGVFNTKGLVWATVHHTRLTDDAVHYRLVVSSDGITFPAMGAPALAEPTVDVGTRAAVAPMEAAASDDVMAGDGPESALMPDGEWRKIESGEQHWYMLPIKANRPIEVSIFGSPSDVASFTIRTDEEVKVWQNTGQEACIGCGTVNAVARGDFFWAGMFNQKGEIWIVVDHLNRSGETGFYRIVVDGTGVNM